MGAPWDHFDLHVKAPCIVIYKGDRLFVRGYIVLKVKSQLKYEIGERFVGLWYVFLEQFSEYVYAHIYVVGYFKSYIFLCESREREIHVFGFKLRIMIIRFKPRDVTIRLKQRDVALEFEQSCNFLK